MSNKTDWQKPFTVRTITREDLFTAGFPRWQVAGLSDAEMQQIAAQMAVSYGDSFFWEDLESATNAVLCLRTGTNIIGEPLFGSDLQHPRKSLSHDTRRTENV